MDGGVEERQGGGSEVGEEGESEAERTKEERKEEARQGGRREGRSFERGTAFSPWSSSLTSKRNESDRKYKGH